MFHFIFFFFCCCCCYFLHSPLFHAHVWILDKLRGTAKNNKDPLFCFYEREVRKCIIHGSLCLSVPLLIPAIFSTRHSRVLLSCLSLLVLLQVNTGHCVLMDIRCNKADVVMICEGKKKLTNFLRSIPSELAKG